MVRWTGNGVADGNAVTGTTGSNVNTAGNGDTMTRATSGTTTHTYAGDGFDVGGAASSLVKQYFPVTATRDAVQQVFVTPASGSSGAIMYNAFDGTDRCRVDMDMTLGFRLFNYANSEIVAARSAVPVAGHRYQIDWVYCKSASPTTSNGRMFFRVTDLTDPTWSTDGVHFYDTGYTVNVGTTNFTRAGFGKLTSAPAWSNLVRLEQLGAVTTTVDTSHTSQAQAEAYFMASPYVTGDASLAGTASLTATGTRGSVGDSTADVAADLTAAAGITLGGDASRSVSAGLTAAAVANRGAAASAPLTAGLSAAGTRAATGAASRSVAASLTASATVAKTAAASLSVTATRTAAGDTSGSLTAAAAITASATVTSAATRAATAGASSTVTAARSATATRAATAAAVASLTASRTATGVRAAYATVDLQAAVALDADVTLGRFAEASLGLVAILAGAADILAPVAPPPLYRTLIGSAPSRALSGSGVSRSLAVEQPVRTLAASGIIRTLAGAGRRYTLEGGD